MLTIKIDCQTCSSHQFFFPSSSPSTLSLSSIPSPFLLSPHSPLPSLPSPFLLSLSLPSPFLPGEMVQRERDKTVELEFNRLLDSVSHLSHHLHLDQLGGKPLSLGHALELVIQ